MILGMSIATYTFLHVLISLVGIASGLIGMYGLSTLILRGDDEQIVPIGVAALQSAKLVKGAKLKVYPRFPARDAHN